MGSFIWVGFPFKEGSYSYTDAGGEQTVYELVSTKSRGKILRGIFLDLTNMTQNGTVNVYYKIDGTNYRLIKSIPFTHGVSLDGVHIDLSFAFNHSLKITYTEESNEGAVRAIPYNFGYENKFQESK